MAQHLGRRIFVVLPFLGAAVAFVVLRPVRLGLDLSGGAQVVLEAKDREPPGSALARASEGGADDQRPGAVARRPKGDASE
ncbi:MAG TPA: hypothetical protein VF986_04505 [Actinomycetota bacterium]|jgi:preprotein translocase subunit SecD|nr:hypothetical protein [Actinomycetota bacterium]